MFHTLDARPTAARRLRLLALVLGALALAITLITPVASAAFHAQKRSDAAKKQGSHAKAKGDKSDHHGKPKADKPKPDHEDKPKPDKEKPQRKPDKPKPDRDKPKPGCPEGKVPDDKGDCRTPPATPGTPGTTPTPTPGTTGTPAAPGAPTTAGTQGTQVGGTAPVATTTPAPRRPAANDVAGTQARSARASLRAPRRCASRAFRVTVSGRSIRTVTFSVAGRRVRSVTVPAGRRTLTVSLPVRRFGARRQSVQARVTFRNGAPARTLAASATRCAQGAVAPQFTG